MTVIAFLSVKGAPGVSTLACLVGATWPGPRRVALVEADPFGGDLAARFQLSTAWGWSSYVTASRRSEVGVPIEPHVQTLPGGLEVMVLPSGDRRAVSAASVEALLQSTTSSEDGPWDLVVDGGRIVDAEVPVDTTDHHSAIGAWLDRSDRVVMVSRRDPPSVLKVRERAPALTERCGDRLGLVLVGRGPHDAQAIEEFIGIEVVGAVPYDPGAAQVAAGERGSSRHLARSLLVVSARRLALLLSDADAATDADADTRARTGEVPGAAIRGVRRLRGRLRRGDDGEATDMGGGADPSTEGAPVGSVPTATPLPTPLPTTLPSSLPSPRPERDGAATGADRSAQTVMR